MNFKSTLLNEDTVGRLIILDLSRSIWLHRKERMYSGTDQCVQEKDANHLFLIL